MCNVVIALGCHDVDTMIWADGWSVFYIGLCACRGTLRMADTQMQGSEIDKLLQELLDCVDNYIWTETKWRDWVYESRDAEVLTPYCLQSSLRSGQCGYTTIVKRKFLTSPPR